MPSVKSVFFGQSPRFYAPRNPRSLGFEETPLGFDNGRSPSCAINGNNRFIEVHMGETNSTLNFRQGSLERLDVQFSDTPSRGKIADGNNPAVAFNDDNVAIVLADQNDKIKYAAAKVDKSKNANPPFQFTEFPQTGASFPSVALNKAGVVVEVHQSGSNLSYRRGKLDGSTLTFPSGPAKSLIANGTHPSVAINNNGAVVVVFERGGNLYYLTGTFDAAKPPSTAIAFGGNATLYQNSGRFPSVALTDGGEVFATHASGSVDLNLAVGVLKNNQITWQDFLMPGKTAYRYDKGAIARVATNGKVALQMFHSNESGGPKLFGNASLVFDRANWMSDNRGDLADKTLRRIAIPGSHDAGAFAVDAAQTQDLNIRQQLGAGVRYFDLRPKYNGDANKIDATKITTYHTIDYLFKDFLGPTFADIVRNTRTFLQSHNELVIFRISQFKNFNKQVFAAFADLLVGDDKTGLSKWLFPLKNDGKRLADRPLTDFLKPDRGTVLIVVDVDGPNTNPQDKSTDYITDAFRKKGLYRYRDWYAKDPARGDLTVFDVFSNTNTFARMALNDGDGGYTLPATGKQIPRGQLNKFDWFDGLCQKDDKDPQKPSTVQCDLFLLSWTLTPTAPTSGTTGNILNPTAFVGAANANRVLTQYLAIPKYQGANAKGLRMNVLYTDAIEFARAADVALIRNGIGR